MPLLNAFGNIIQNLLTHPDWSLILKAVLFIVLGLFWTKVPIPRNQEDRPGYVPPSNWILMWFLGNYFNTVAAFLILKLVWYPLAKGGPLPMDNYGLTYIWLPIALIYIIWMEGTYFREIRQLYEYDFVRPPVWWKECIGGRSLDEIRRRRKKYADFSGATGEIRIDGTPEEAVKQVFRAFSEWDLERLDNHASDGYLEAETPLSAFSYGEIIHIDLVERDSRGTELKVKVLPVRPWFFEPVTAERRVRDFLKDFAEAGRRVEYQT
jgi:hypothetical protein